MQKLNKITILVKSRINTHKISSVWFNTSTQNMHVTIQINPLNKSFNHPFLNTWLFVLKFLWSFIKLNSLYWNNPALLRNYCCSQAWFFTNAVGVHLTKDVTMSDFWEAKKKIMMGGTWSYVMKEFQSLPPVSCHSFLKIVFHIRFEYHVFTGKHDVLTKFWP